MTNKYLLFLFVLTLGCKAYQAADHEFPKPVDTSTHQIKMQDKKTYSVDGVFADNQFDGARLNGFSQIGDQLFQADIVAENYPINMSPWYSFKLWANEERLIQLVLHYEKGKQRYWPNISWDGKNWEKLDSNFVSMRDSFDAQLDLSIGPDTLWLSAQELVTSKDVKAWCEERATHPDIDFKTIGKSKLGRDMLFMDIKGNDERKKETIVVLSRQHPPEVTGYFAMQAFIDEILEDNALSNAFRQKYRVLVFPLMNPDGVDLGHWRHSAGGIDLNRDWAYYRQPETRLVSDYIVKTVKENKGKVLVGLDFHSTWYDVYYTGSDEMTSRSVLPHFKDYWLRGISGAMDGKIPHEASSGFGSPVTKGWFYKQFNAEGITYEIGDNTPRDFIQKKGKIAAQELMSLLIFR